MDNKPKKDILARLYLVEKKSSAEIANLFKCSVSKINYWLARYNVSKRSISEAVYTRRNPKGDPFVESVLSVKTPNEYFLYGLGLGLYWGEGTKSNTHSIRLGNTDPKLIRTFIKFLRQIYKIKPDKLKFGLQVFNDVPKIAAKKYWLRQLQARPSQFQKIVVSPPQGIGTYRKKAQYGVVTVYYHNKKLRDILCHTIDTI